MRYYTRLILIAGVMSCRAEGTRVPPIFSGVRETLSAMEATGQDAAGLTLAAYSTRDTIHGRDAIVIGTLVRNWGASRRFRNDPEFYHFTLFGPSGAQLSPIVGNNLEWNLGPLPELVLGHDEIIGQLSNISCFRNAYANEFAGQPCLWGYILQQPGTYKIVVRYESIVVRTNGTQPPPIRLASDTVRLVYSP